jgi:hypothetical protein
MKARVLVAVEAQPDLKLCVKFIRIVDDENFEPDTLVFEWFNMVGNSREDARRNCVASIAYYVRCRPDLRESILGALDETCALEVAGAIGVKT